MGAPTEIPKKKEPVVARRSFPTLQSVTEIRFSHLTRTRSINRPPSRSPSPMGKRGETDGGVPLSRFGVLVAQLESIAASARHQPPDPLLCFDLVSELVAAIEDEPKVSPFHFLSSHILGCSS